MQYFLLSIGTLFPFFSILLYLVFSFNHSAAGAACLTGMGIRRNQSSNARIVCYMFIPLEEGQDKIRQTSTIRFATGQISLMASNGLRRASLFILQN
ncbi:hypothetical protein ACFX2K_001720 [Malus domestica]